jgi:hypothetical protein
MFRFVAGAIAGGIVVYLYGDRLKEILDDTAERARTKAAQGLESVGATAEGALDSAKEQLRSGVQAGQEYLRPAQEAPSSPNTYR